MRKNVQAVRSSLLLLLLSSPTAFAATLSYPAGQVIDSFVVSLYPASEPGAAIVVSKGGETILRRGYGTSAVGSAVPIQPTTSFRVGSISKQFTAIGILLLVQDGAISLNDPVNKYFYEFPRFFGKVTIEHLLTHTSGLRNYTSIDKFHRIETKPSTEDIVLAIRDSSLSFNPGEAWEYSDSNYFLLGVIIERVSGVPYCRFMADRIFTRFDLTHTRCASIDALCDQVPAGFWKLNGVFAAVQGGDPEFQFSAGSILSTVDDLLRWYRVLKTGTLLRRDLYDRLLSTSRLASGEPTLYGYGWAVHDIDGIKVIEHGGMVDGFENHVLWMPEEDIFVTVLSNSRGRNPTPDVLATRIALYLSSHHLPLVDTPPDPGRFGSVLGRYRLAGRTYEVALHNGYVEFSRAGGPWIRLVQLLDGRLVLENTLTFVSFQPDREGKPGTLIMKTKYGKEWRPAYVPPSAYQGKEQNSRDLTARPRFRPEQ